MSDKLKKYSWATTILGVALITKAISTAVAHLLDGDPATTVSMSQLTELIMGGIGVMARDNKKSSEQVGAK